MGNFCSRSPPADDDEKEARTDQHALLDAVAQNRFEDLKRLLSLVDLNAPIPLTRECKIQLDRSGFKNNVIPPALTALAVAANVGTVEMVEHLISVGAHCTDPLLIDIAMQRRSPTPRSWIMNVLISSGLHRAVVKPRSLWPILDDVFRGNDVDLLKVLVQQDCVDLDALHNEGIREKHGKHHAEPTLTQPPQDTTAAAIAVFHDAKCTITDFALLSAVFSGHEWARDEACARRDRFGIPYDTNRRSLYRAMLAPKLDTLLYLISQGGQLPFPTADEAVSHVSNLLGAFSSQFVPQGSDGKGEHDPMHPADRDLLQPLFDGVRQAVTRGLMQREVLRDVWASDVQIYSRMPRSCCKLVTAYLLDRPPRPPAWFREELALGEWKAITMPPLVPLRESSNGSNGHGHGNHGDHHGFVDHEAVMPTFEGEQFEPVPFKFAISVGLHHSSAHLNTQQQSPTAAAAAESQSHSFPPLGPPAPHLLAHATAAAVAAPAAAAAPARAEAPAEEDDDAGPAFHED